MNTLTHSYPLPFAHLGRGHIVDASGRSVAWLALERDRGLTPEGEQLVTLIVKSPELLAAVARVARLVNTHFRKLCAADLPPEFFLATGELIGHAVACGVEPSAISPSGEGGVK